jgi:hypothetical protein
MTGLRALRLAIGDMWEESTMVVSIGLLGLLLSLFILPFPFVLAAHYGTADRVREGRFVSWRVWFQAGREQARFFYQWVILVTLVALTFVANFYFYQRFDGSWATALRWLMIGLLLLWLIPQPLVPALYIRQHDRRLRIALRNAAVLLLRDPLTLLVLWGVTLLLALPLAYVALPLLAFLPVLVAFISTRIVALQVSQAHEASE